MKSSKYFFIAIFSILFVTPLFSKQNSFRSIKLDFQISEESLNGDNHSSNGKIEYNADPYIFKYTIENAKTITYEINPQGCFYTSENQIKDFSNGVDIIYDYAVEILTLLENNYNLQEDYKPYESNFINNQIITKYIRNDNSRNANNFFYINTFTDDKNRITQSEFLNSELKTAKKIYLSNFLFKNGTYYPQEATVEYFKDNKKYLTTNYKFSNIELNSEISKNYNQNIIEIQITNQNQKVNQIKKYGKVVTPSMTAYKTSFLQIAVDLSFSFYKKFITNQDNSNCGYNPTCSQYMKEAINKNGFLGIFQGIDRLSRCTEEQHKSNLYKTDENGKQIDLVE